MNYEEIHDAIVDNLTAFITRPDDTGLVSPADNVQCLITLIKCSLLDLGYTDEEACDIIDDN